MDNLTSPAYPHQLSLNSLGFTKLEIASLMIAQGMSATWIESANPSQYRHISEVAVELAKAVLEQANQ